ncbi:Trp biosynthesis-associated membrane protein [Pseudolysinimonas sp.]|uniref:Trp biosynthesis-associated membrane protein n=1 Tax=Pseudolysinimonas sp. TaxID=2680009 RepID=UPI003F7E10B5
MTAARLRLVSLLAVGAVAALALLAWSQTWFRITVDGRVLAVGGSVAGAAMPALALTSLAVILALALAGPFFRAVLGVLEALLGVAMITTSAFALADPVAASLPAITKATGLAGRSDAVAGAHEATGWPVLAIVAGVLAVLVGLAIAVTSRRWPSSSRRFTRTRTEAADATAAEADPVREWDALSEGDDPTRPTP